MKIWRRVGNIRLITVGTKVLFGVALATNTLIGVLLYVNLHSAGKIENTVNDVLEIREKLSTNLRDTVVALQNDFLAL
ncbi:MAG: hypothetical protein V2I36_11040 [Desulfopila sp.]|jgi:hypothetical protein|nr:hypothetical protein [Desulfopila sp.]